MSIFIINIGENEMNQMMQQPPEKEGKSRRRT